MGATPRVRDTTTLFEDRGGTTMRPWPWPPKPDPVRNAYTRLHIAFRVCTLCMIGLRIGGAGAAQTETPAEATAAAVEQLDET